MPPELPEDLLGRLREIREAEDFARGLAPERNLIIREAIKRGYTQGELEIATGLDQSVISRIAMRRA